MSLVVIAPHSFTVGLTNPADHILDSMAIARTDSSCSLANTNEDQRRVNLLVGEDKPTEPLRSTTPWTAQFCILLERILQEHIRKKNIFMVSLAQSVIMAVLVGMTYLKVGFEAAAASLH